MMVVVAALSGWAAGRASTPSWPLAAWLPLAVVAAEVQSMAAPCRRALKAVWPPC